MIVVSNRVQVPPDRVEQFRNRLRSSYGIEEQPGFLGMKLLAPIDAEGHVTMTFWESRDDYEAWQDSTAFDQAHDGRDAADAFETTNEVEIHEVVIERGLNTAESGDGES